MHVAMIASEAAPFVRTGGLGEMIGSLAKALAYRGHRVDVYVPYYREVARRQGTVLEGRVVRVVVGTEMVEAMVRRLPDEGEGPLRFRFIEVPGAFDRAGVYGEGGEDYPDNARRFVLFQRAVLEHLQDDGRTPDLLHVHDWPSALVPVYTRTLYPRIPTLLTIHNLAFQGRFRRSELAVTGLDWDLFNWRQLEFFGGINWLKGGIVFADHITAVSPTYAEEIQTKEFGCGLHGVLRERRQDLTGILNGIDTEIWDPASDPHLPVPFDANRLDGKRRSKEALRERLGLETDGDPPLLGLVARLDEQKGIDLVAEALPGILGENAQLALLGVGAPRWERAFGGLVQQHPGRAAAVFRFDDSLAHLIEAGSDFFLMPSRYEPCGLNQIYSQRYGTLPIVRRTGGLVDTVVPFDGTENAASAATGFAFLEPTPEAFLEAVRTAVRLYREAPATIEALRRNAMSREWSWNGSAGAYEGLYARILARGDAVPSRGE